MSRFIRCELCGETTPENDATKWTRVSCDGEVLDYCPSCGLVVRCHLRNRTGYLDKLSLLCDTTEKLVNAVAKWARDENIRGPGFKQFRDRDLIRAFETYYEESQACVADLAREAKE